MTLLRRVFVSLGASTLLMLSAALVSPPVASAASSSIGYTVTALQTNIQGELQAISCPSPGSCVAVGNSTNSSSGAPLVETLTAGTWTPTSIGPSETNLNGIWCASVSACIAVGGPTGGEGTSQAVVETLANGTWSATASSLDPAGAVSATLNTISCLNLTSCVAAGSYTDSAGDVHALFEAFSGGSWVPMNSTDPSGSINAQINSIQCFTATSCVAVGSWGPNANTNYPLLETLVGSAWTATTLSSSDGLLRSVSCPLSTSCMAVGYEGSGQGLTETLANGQWTSGLIPIPSGTSMNGIVGVSCPTEVTACVALGGYREPPSASYADTLIETLADGAWTPTTDIDPSSGAGFPEGLSCPTITTCVGVGLLDTAPAFSFHPMAVTAQPHGYWLVGSDGGIFTFGFAQFYGSTGNLTLQRPVVGITPTADRGGYWLVASDGGVFSFGDTQFYGSIPGIGISPAGSGAPHSLNAPIVGMVPSVDQRGYFMVAADGGVFAFGDAQFEGSCPGIGGCAGAAVAVMPDATGKGYWLVTNSGNIYTFGDALYYGAPGPQGSPVASAVRTPDGGGYWILLADGAVYAYGDAVNFGGATSSVSSLDPASAIFATSDGKGYWVASADGGVFTYGDAPFDGSMAGTKLNGQIIAASGF